MKKFLFVSAIALFCSQNVQAELIDFDLESLETLKTHLPQISQNNSLVFELTETISAAERGKNPSLSTVQCAAIEQAINATRKPGTYLPTAQFREAGSPEAKLAVIAQFHADKGYTEEERAAFRAKLEAIQAPALSGLQDDNVMAIAKQIQQFPLRQFTYKLLGITPDYATPSLEEKMEVFSLLKKSGVLRTSIEDLPKFQYNPVQEVANFLNDHPEIDSITMGCGHFIPENSTNELIRKIAGGHLTGCQSCPHPTHHKGELTIDTQIGENPDVVADGTNGEIWKSLPNRFTRIIDESWAHLCESEELMGLLKSALKPGGKIVEREYTPEGAPIENILYTKPL